MVENKNNMDYEKDLEEKFEYVKNELKLPVEKVGKWLWVDCTSASKKEKLEKKGFKYSKTRFLFYYSNQTSVNQRRYYRPIPMNELKSMYANQQMVIAK